MGKNHSKEKFSQWDLDRFSNITKIPRDKVAALYQEFVASSGKDNRMDKKEFRRLYKELYISRQPTGTQDGPSAPAMWSDHDLNKMADHVFKAFDRGSGKLSFEDFVNAYLLLDNSPGIASTGVSPQERFAYILENNYPESSEISREQGEDMFNKLNVCYTGDSELSGDGKTWEHHWTQINDGNNTVTQEKFVQYFTLSDAFSPKLRPTTA
ncbi:unnamed protein product [Adineta ricciae]|uniref:Uncharacterized protein n=1 Tax=Adineta ricciae TaxID=249248 RepID=A0A813YCL7_ADIRI|nr:unnamed protein product [Adineta ricciae]CAF1277724.1 unnamed protein product [Adineta ricciae]